MSLHVIFRSEIPEATCTIGEQVLGSEDVCLYLGQHIDSILPASSLRG